MSGALRSSNCAEFNKNFAASHSKFREITSLLGLFCWTAFYGPPRARCQTVASAPAIIRARLSAQRFVKAA